MQLRVEFQVRGSPHIHSIIWILNLLTLSRETKEKYNSKLDKIIRTLPDFKQEPKLFNLIKTFQIYRHTKTCQRYKNGNCPIHYGRFFTEKTIIAKPLPYDMPSNEKVAILEKRNLHIKKGENLFR